MKVTLKIILVIICNFIFLAKTFSQQTNEDKQRRDSLKLQLALTEEQKTKLNSINHQFLISVNRIPKDLTAEERKQRIEDAEKLQLKEIKNLFSPEQYEIYIKARERELRIADEKAKQRTSQQNQ